MAWSNSKMFNRWVMGVMGQGQTSAVLPAAYAGLGADTINVALYNNSITPDKDATLANSGFNAGQWATTNEVVDTLNSNWATGGRALASKALTATSGTTTFSAANLAGAGTLTVTNAYGCFIYDNTITAGTGGVAKQGVCFNYFGGAQSVTAGTFTIVWNASGIFAVTV